MNKELIAIGSLLAVVTAVVLCANHYAKKETPLAVRDGVPVFQADDERPIFLTTRGCAQLKTGTMLILVTCPADFSVSATYPEPKPWGEGKW